MTTILTPIPLGCDTFSIIIDGTHSSFLASSISLAITSMLCDLKADRDGDVYPGAPCILDQISHNVPHPDRMVAKEIDRICANYHQFAGMSVLDFTLQSINEPALLTALRCELLYGRRCLMVNAITPIAMPLLSDSICTSYLLGGSDVNCSIYDTMLNNTEVGRLLLEFKYKEAKSLISEIENSSRSSSNKARMNIQTLLQPIIEEINAYQCLAFSVLSTISQTDITVRNAISNTSIRQYLTSWTRNILVSHYRRNIPNMTDAMALVNDVNPPRKYATILIAMCTLQIFTRTLDILDVFKSRCVNSETLNMLFYHIGRCLTTSDCNALERLSHDIRSGTTNLTTFGSFAKSEFNKTGLGVYSNYYTYIDRFLLESSLVQLYQNVKTYIEDNYPKNESSLIYVCDNHAVMYIISTLREHISDTKLPVPTHSDFMYMTGVMLNMIRDNLYITLTKNVLNYQVGINPLLIPLIKTMNATKSTPKIIHIRDKLVKIVLKSVTIERWSKDGKWKSLQELIEIGAIHDYIDQKEISESLNQVLEEV